MQWVVGSGVGGYCGKADDRVLNSQCVWVVGGRGKLPAEGREPQFKKGRLEKSQFHPPPERTRNDRGQQLTQQRRLEPFPLLPPPQ
jgi:hypothetical protein